MNTWARDGRYTLSAFGGDVAGGLVAALIALPYGLAMALLMGLPPFLGVLTSLITGPICAVLGRNPVLIGGTSSVTVPFIAAAVRHQGVAGSAKICLLSAVIMIVFCILRLGRYVARVPYSVLSGFSCGVGAMMVISQLRTVFALPAPGAGWSETMLPQLAQVAANIARAQPIPIFVALTVIIGSSVSAYLFPKGPSPLLGVLCALLCTTCLGWHPKQTGLLPLGLPALPALHWKTSDFWLILPNSIGLAVVSAINLLMTSRVVMHFWGRHRQVTKRDADLELGAYGIANLAAGAFGAPVSVGIPARSLANVQCGGTTRVSNLAHALFLLCFLTGGRTFIAHIPLAALAGVTVWMGARLLEWSTWRRLPKMRRVDALAFVFTATSVLVMNAVMAVLIGCACYLPYLFGRSSADRRRGSAEVPIIRTRST